MQKKLLLMMLVPILALSFAITSCGGDDDGFVHNVELVGSGFGPADVTDLWALFAVFDRPIDVRTRDFRVEGLRVDRAYGFETLAMQVTTAPTVRPATPWLPVGTAFNPNRLIIGVDAMNMVTDTINVADFEGFTNHENAFWVNIPLAGLVHGDVVGASHAVILHEQIRAIPAPVVGWAGFRLTMGDVEGYNVTHGRGARMVSANWNAFFAPGTGAGLQPGPAGTALLGPPTPFVIDAIAGPVTITAGVVLPSAGTHLASFEVAGVDFGAGFTFADVTPAMIVISLSGTTNGAIPLTTITFDIVNIGGTATTLTFDVDITAIVPTPWVTDGTLVINDLEIEGLSITPLPTFTDVP